MSCLIKKNKRDYYSRVSVRVGDRQSNKRKDVYIKLDTYKYSFANGMRTIDKNGIDKVLADIRARGEKI
jgi:ribosomal protein L28